MDQFDTVRPAGLPPHAWCFRLDAERRELLAGSAVQVFDEGFFEGCHAGADAIRSLDREPNVFGSGMVIRDGAAWFVGPSHPIEALYVLRHAGGDLISNSLAFLVEAAGVDLPHDRRYACRFATLVNGFDDYEQLVASGSDWQIRRIAFDNFRCTPHGGLELRRKPAEDPLRDFDDYVSRLKSILGRAFSHAARHTAYQPLATCSSGYDSLAGAVLARPLGCRDAVTVRQARGGVSDSAAEPARLLGLSVTEVDCVTSAAFDAFAEFAATGMGGEDVSMLALEPHLGRRVLLLGYHGDKVWDLHTAISPVLGRGDIAGASFQEFRLRVGFMQIPVPMILARQHEHIRAISRSAELAPFRIGGRYDRPIPRRIIEEAGVPRGSFATEKKAISTLIFFTPGLLTDDGTARRVWSPAWVLRMWAGRLLGKVAGRRIARMITGDWRVFEHAHPRNSSLFVAAVERVRARYRLAGVNASAAGQTS